MAEARRHRHLSAKSRVIMSLVGIVLALVSCRSTLSAAKPAPRQVGATPPDVWVMTDVNAFELRQWGWPCEPLPGFEGTWLPDERVLGRLEADLPRVRKLYTFAPAERDPIGNPYSYDRQYLGVVVEGRRWIFVNAFTAPGSILVEIEGVDPTREIFSICDGHADHWTVLYDPKRRHFPRLIIREPRFPVL